MTLVVSCSYERMVGKQEVIRFLPGCSSPDTKEPFRRMENSLRSCLQAAPGPLTFGCSTCKPRRRETLRTHRAVSGHPGPPTVIVIGGIIGQPLDA